MQSCRVTVDLGAFGRNIDAVRGALGGGCEIMAVVKADAYGHGLAEIGARAAARGVRWFAVATATEAWELRAAAPESEILLLGPAEAGDVPGLLGNCVTPVVVGAAHARALGTAARALGEELRAHVKVDTGMGRLGVFGEDPSEELRAILREPGLRIEGICSHFATVEPLRIGSARDQYRRFSEAVDFAERESGRRLRRHISSSRAMQFYRDWDLDLVRPGIVLYGYGSAEAGMRSRTEPILEWRTGLLQVKTVPEATPVGYYSSYRTTETTDIGTIAVGYADGYLRSLSNLGEALAGGRRRRVVGRVSMNWVTLELGPDSGLRAGDDVVLIGRQEDDAIWADEMSRWAGTIAYEILVGIHPSIPRAYVG